MERISKKAVEVLKQKDIIQIFPSMRKNNRTVRVLKEPKTDSSIRKVYIPSSVAILLAELREEQNETIEALGDMYENYNLVMATSYGLPLGESYLRDKMQEVIDRGFVNVVCIQTLFLIRLLVNLKQNNRIVLYYCSTKIY